MKINTFCVLAVLAIIIGAVIGLNSAYKGYEIIKPEPGITCAKVTGLYNTSISCWKSEQ